jgi:hypothetical protein
VGDGIIYEQRFEITRTMGQTIDPDARAASYPSPESSTTPLHSHATRLSFDDHLKRRYSHAGTFTIPLSRSSSLRSQREAGNGIRSPNHSRSRSVAGGTRLASPAQISGRVEKAPEQSKSKWSYVPLFFALFPACAGIFLGNGETYTDIMLLCLAGIYLHGLIECESVCVS